MWAFGEQDGNGTGSSQSDSEFRCQEYSTRAPYFISTLPILSEGQAGEAWEPSNKLTFFRNSRKMKRKKYFCLSFKGYGNVIRI
jgi:hypothetical protein